VLATARYVDGNQGSDAHDGLSLSTAYQTVQKCATVAVAGGKFVRNLLLFPSHVLLFFFYY
jgi:hypothetical protein